MYTLEALSTPFVPGSLWNLVQGCYFAQTSWLSLKKL